MKIGAEGKGTTFTLFFPVTRREMKKDGPPLSKEEDIGRGESILVVDDVEEPRTEVPFNAKYLRNCSITTVA